LDVNPHSSPSPLAARWGHLEIVQLLLNRGADVNASSDYERPANACEYEYIYYGCSALLVASFVGHVHIVRTLLKPAYGLSTSGIEYEKAILTATRSGHADLIRLLLEKMTGQSPASLPKLHREIFWEASYSGRELIVRMMLENGVDVNAERTLDLEYTYLLQLAALRGYDNVMRLLLDSGADGDFSEGYHGPVLLDYGADVNGIEDYMRPLVVAARKGQVHMIQFLLRKGADICINAPEHNGHDLTVGARVLTSAVYHGLSPVVRILVEAGVSPNNPKEIFDPVLCAMSIGQHHVLETLFEL
ncbi:hypothetical protein RUND412_011359, partial [Rhizina undulata]